ncbi:MAG: hypothetical protein MR051_00980 [Lentisphaeria bacterium]|nr:hypothetical protein [Lentisphaeria bacterium]
MRSVGKFFPLAAALWLIWSAAGADLTAVLPSYTAMTGRIDAAALRNDPSLRALIPAVMPETLCGIAREDIREIVFASDAKVRRVTAALEAASDEAWQRILNQLEPYLAAEAGTSGQEVYRIRNAGKDLNGGFFLVPAQRVGVFILPDPTDGGRPDCSGAPAKVRRMLPAGSPLAVGGTPRIKSEPFRSIKSFQAELRKSGGSPLLVGEADFAQPMHAAFGQVALLTAFSMWLQEYAGLTPEGAADIVSRIKVLQQGTKLRFEFSDFDLLARYIRDAERV